MFVIVRGWKFKSKHFNIKKLNEGCYKNRRADTRWQISLIVLKLHSFTWCAATTAFASHVCMLLQRLNSMFDFN